MTSKVIHLPQNYRKLIDPDIMGRDLHTHTRFSDGGNTPEEMVRSGISLGLSAIGISDHAHTAFDETYCIKPDALQDYIRTIRELKHKYSSDIEILSGIEQDMYSDTGTDGYDYIIGSLHYIHIEDEYIPVDETAAILKAAADKYYSGDMISLARQYYIQLSDVLSRTGADITGHFDLISKFNEKTPLFDESDPQYIRAALDAADALLPFKKPFEINVGAITRGYRTTPYPAPFIAEYIASKGGSFVYSSDSHSVSALEASHPCI